MLQEPLPNAPRPIAFSVIRVPFFLEPHYDETKPFIGTNRERLVDKWGGQAGWERQKRHHDLKGRGMEAGIPHFNLDRLTSNTMASHRLIQHIGKTYGLAVSEAVYDRLNVYYFVDGHALNDRPRLAQVVADELKKILPDNDDEAPPSADSLLEFLNSNRGRKEIEHTLHALEEMGVHGIPKFIIEGRSTVGGAARAEVFVDIFRDIEARGEIFGGPVFGNLLGISKETIEQGSHRVEDVTAA